MKRANTPRLLSMSIVRVAPSCFTRLLLLVLISWLAAASSGCDSTDGPPAGDCIDTPISPTLSRLFYWGDSGGSDYLPNTGPPVGEVRQPLWISPNTILTLSEAIVEDTQIKGIFAVTLDPATMEFDSVHAYEFSGVRWSYDYDAATNKILLTYSTSPGVAEIGIGDLSGDQLVLDQVLVGSPWIPSGVQLWPGRPGFVFYGTNPTDQTSGFYWHIANSDSLLLSVGLSYSEARCFRFSSDGSVLYYGTALGAVFGSSRVYRVNTADFANPVSIDERRGSYVSLDVNPIDGRVLINRFLIEPSGSRFVLVDSDGGNATTVDVRTHESSCRFVLALDPSWNPGGEAFAFSGGAFTGEGVKYPMALWLSRSGSTIIQKGEEQ